MFITLIIWIYVFFLSFTYGSVFINFLNKKLDTKDYYNNFSVCLIVGIVLITVIAQFYSLFDKVGLTLNGLLSAGAFYILFKDCKSIVSDFKKAFSGYKIIDFTIIFAVLIFFLYKASIVKLHGDSYLYLIDSVKWIEDFGVIKGLGNLYGRLAFNSSWLVAQALFGFSFLLDYPVHTLNEWLLFSVFLYLYQSVKNAIWSVKFSSICTIKLFVAFLFVNSILFDRVYIPSLSADIPNFLFLSIIFFLFIDSNTEKKDNQIILSFLITMLAFFVVSIKLSALPVLILPLYFLIKDLLKKNRQLFGMYFFISIVVFLPFVIRNVFLSGYLIYPFPYLDLFTFDWKVPLEYVIKEKMCIKGWAIVPEWGCVINLPIVEWFPVWIKRWDIFDIFFWHSILYLSIFNLLKLFSDFKAKQNFEKNLILYSTLYCGLIFWFYTAPDFRFGYGFLIILSVLSVINTKDLVLARLNLNLSQKTKNLIKSSLITLCVVISFSITSLGLDRNMVFDNLKSYCFFPAKCLAMHPKVNLEKVVIDGYDVFLPKTHLENPKGYYAFPLNKVKLRGKSIKDGFKIEE